MGEIDSECYNKLIKEIHDKHHLAVILAGHIHAYDELLEEESFSILVSDKLYNPANSNALNGYVIEFNSSSAHPSFTHRRLSDPSLMSSPKKNRKKILEIQNQRKRKRTGASSPHLQFLIRTALLANSTWRSCAIPASCGRIPALCWDCWAADRF